MNESEIEWMAGLVPQIEQWADRKFPVAQHAADTLLAYMRWVNRNSDGWPYWNKGRRAAERLTRLIEAWRHAYTSGQLSMDDLDEQEVARAIAPMRRVIKMKGDDPDVARLRRTA